MSAKLVYGDIALGAADAAQVSVSNKINFSAPELVPFGVQPVAIATLEPGGWGLSHDYKLRDAQQVAFWSSVVSGADCVFSTAPTVTLAFSAQFSATGLTFRFSEASGDYCRKIGVTWYQGATVKDSGTYYPDATFFVIENTVEAFDKIVVSLQETNLPRRRAKLEYIGIGVIREFHGTELVDVAFVHEIDLISKAIPINVLDAAFHSKSDVEYVFQKKQPVEAYNGTALVGVYYIENGRRTGVRDYTIACQDAIGILELDDYGGNIWFSDTPAKTILADVVGGGFELDIDTSLSNKTLRGYIPPGTRRAALQQVAFALGACVDTSGTSKIKVFPAYTGAGEEIAQAKTYEGGNVETADTVTEVTVTAYVFFDERPSGEQPYIELNGIKYRYYTETKHAYNPNAVEGDPARKEKFDKCYLCNLSNAQERADQIMQYYMRRETYTARHVVSGQQVGDRVTMHLPWGGTSGGNLVRMAVSMSGLTVSETEFLMD